MNINWNVWKSLDGNSNLTNPELLTKLLTQTHSTILDKQIFIDFSGENVYFDDDVYYRRVHGRKIYMDLRGGSLNFGEQFGFKPQGFHEDKEDYYIGSGTDSDVRNIKNSQMELVVMNGWIRDGGVQFLLLGFEALNFERVDFWRGEKNIQGVFCLRSTIEKCKFYAPKEVGVMLESGADAPDVDDFILQGGTGDNSASNMSVVRDCRFLGHNENTPTGVMVLNSNMVNLENIIFEGGSFDYHVFTDLNTNTTRDFYMDVIHIESPAVIASIRAHSKKLIQLNRIFNQKGGLLFDLDAPSVQINNPSYLVKSQGMFKMNKSQEWDFNGLGKEFNNKYFWVDGKVPRQLRGNKGLVQWFRSGFQFHAGDNIFGGVGYRNSQGESNGGKVFITGFNSRYDQHDIMD